MIFVTVGTERFPFDRLIRAVDELHDVLQGEPVFMQTGYGTYTPSCEYQRFLPFNEYREKIRQARIVVSHAGAGTFLNCAEFGKVPIMMARRRCFGEHVDDHQEMLVKRMAERGLILLAAEPEELRENIFHYEELCQSRTDSYPVEPALVNHLKAVLDAISEKIGIPKALV